MLSLVEARAAQRSAERVRQRESPNRRAEGAGVLIKDATRSVLLNRSPMRSP